MINFDLTGKTALITGSTRGLGFAIATAFADHGARVAINGRDPQGVAEAMEQLGDTPLPAVAAAFDVADSAATRQVVGDLLSAHGSIDILVNNAGIIHRAPLSEISDEDWCRVLDVNINGAFRLAKLCLPGMTDKGWGRIINIGSVMSQVARPTISPYVTSKHAINGLTKALAVEFGPAGITCNTIGPGYFATELNAPLVADKEFDAMVKSRTPAGRWGQVEEIAAMAVYLASEAAGYTNGGLLMVDGGMTAAL